MSFENFREITDKFSSLYTIVVRNLSKVDFIEQLSNKCNIMKNTKDTHKGRYRSTRLGNFIGHVRELEITKFNHVFLIGPSSEDNKNGIETIPLTNSQIRLLNDFDVRNFIFKNSDLFEIDYLESLLNDETYKHVIYVNNNDLEHIHLNLTKKRTHKKSSLKHQSLYDYFTNEVPKNEKCVIHGVSSHFKSLRDHPYVYVYTYRLSDQEIFDRFHQETVLENQKLLESCFQMLSNEKTMDIVSYGKKQISKDIKNQLVKTAYCSPEMEKKLRLRIPELLNFRLITVDSLKPGDPGDRLVKEFSGLIGIRYY